MAMDASAEPASTERRHAVPAALRFAPWLALAALFVTALALRHWLAANTDVSWLLTVADRVLDGQRLYVDVIETNPPMAVLTYIPGVLVARMLGLPAEMVTDALVFVAIFISLAIAANILKHLARAGGGRAGGRSRCWLLRCWRCFRPRLSGNANISR